MKSAVLTLAALLACAGAVRAEDSLEQPVPVRTVAPVFPEELRRAGISGLVLVSCLVDARGAVQDMRVEKASNHLFVQPAIDALGQWRFKPAERGGNRVPIRVAIPIRFTVGE
jgi:protein TonB